MEFTYRYRRQIAKFSLVPFGLMLLLALNFMMWGYGTCMEDSLEYHIMIQTRDMEHCIITNIIRSDNINEHVQIKLLPDVSFIGILTSFILLALSNTVLIYRSYLPINKRDTLVSLCVRMDD